MRVFLLLLSIILASLVQAQKPIGPLLQEIEVLMEKKGMPGLMLSITTKDSIIYSGGLGFANISSKEKVTANHLFRMGSISKGFTAIGLLKLEHEGKLSIDDFITSVDPTFRNKYPVTIAQALEHTAGFDDMHFKAIYNLKDDEEPATTDLVKLHETALQSRWPPGTIMSYSNPGYVLAGHIIETISGQKYADYLKENVLYSIGMNSSGFAFKQPASPLMTEGYYPMNGKLQVQKYMSIQGGPAGSLVSSANDMSAYLMWVLNKKENLFQASKFDRLERSQTSMASKQGLPGGYGLGNGNSWRYGFPFHGHNGGIDGYASDYTYSREANIGIAIASNSTIRPEGITNLILKYYLGDQQPPLKRKLFPIPESFIAEYAGFYQFLGPRNQLMGLVQSMWKGVNIDFEEGMMITSDLMHENHDTLYYGGNNQFYSREGGLPHAMFLENGAFWIGSAYAVKSSLLIRWSKNIAFLFSVLVCFSFLIYGVFWFPISFAKNWKVNREARAMLWFSTVNLFSSISLFLYCLGQLSVKDTFNPESILLFVSTLTLLAFVFISLQKTISLDSKSMIFKLYFTGTTLALILITCIMFTNGLIGFRLWTY